MKHFIFGFITGGAICGGASFVATKYYYGKVLHKELDEMRRHYKERYSPKVASVGEKKDPCEIVKDYISEERRTIDRAELERPSEDAPEEYYDDDEADSKEEDRRAEEAAKYDHAHRHKEPVQIPVASFGEAPAFDTKSYTYYTEDFTLTDEDDHIVDDEIGLFGDTLEDWKKDASVGTAIYVRNFNISTDFEVTKFFGPYEP